MGPLRVASEAPVPPHRLCTICAAIEIAVSSGVRAPRSRPIGECSRANSSSVSPASLRRARRSSCVRREPIAPTYPAFVRSAMTNAGTSNLASWVSTAITVLGSTCCFSSQRWGQSTTTSSASWKRFFVAKIGRASTTVTLKPSSLPTRTRAAEKSIAPNMNICGAGA